MEEKQKTKDQTHFLDYLIIFYKRKKLIIYMTFGAAVVSAITVLLLSDVFMSEARIMPPSQGNAAAAQLLNQFTGGLSLSSILGGGTSDLYAGMLQSRSVLDGVISKFDLMKLYEEDNLIDTREELKDNIKVDTDPKSGIVTVSVYDKDPKRAANMANAFIDELKKLSSGLAISDAAQRRLYYEEQLKATKLNLEKAEEALKAFGEKTGVLQVEEQGKAVFEGIAALRAQIAAKEVEIKVMKSYSTPNNPDLQKLEDALRALRAEANKLEAKGGSGFDPLMSAGRMPAAAMEGLRLMRDVKFNEKLFEMLMALYETAKLDEAKTASIIQVVDTAIPSDKKAKPKRALLVLLAMSAGFFMSVFTVLILETKEKIANAPENTAKIEALRKFRGFGVFRRKQ